MPRNIDQSLKNEILDKVKNQGVSVYLASQETGVSTKTIYSWLKNEVGDSNRSLVLENNRLKKELDNAYRVIGRLTTEVSRPKG